MNKDVNNSNELDSTDEKEQPQAIQERAQRVRYVRGLTTLSREAFCHETQLPTSTLKNWESALAGGLSVSGTQKLIERVEARFNMVCPFEWLYHGQGQAAYLKTPPTQSISPGEIGSQTNTDEAEIMSELALFTHRYPHSVYLKVEDDGLLPAYAPGDYVAGVRLTGSAMNQLIGKVCIVCPKTGIPLLRTLQESAKTDHYRLHCTHLQTTVDLPCLDVPLLYAAEVIRHYRKPCP